MGFLVFVVALLLVPLVTLAQDSTMPGPTWNGIPLLTLFGLLATVITGLLTYLSKKIGAANEAAAAQSSASAAMIRLGAIGFAMVGDLWTTFSAEFQKRIADGQIDADDRAAFRALITTKVEQYTSREELEKLAVAARLPLPGIIAWLAEYAIDRLTQAHDTRNTTVSAGAFPVGTLEDIGGTG